MGTNNRARRAAKQTKRERDWRRSASARPPGGSKAGRANAGPQDGHRDGPHGPGCTCPWPDSAGDTSGREDPPVGIGDVFGSAARAIRNGDAVAAQDLLDGLSEAFPVRDVDDHVVGELSDSVRHAWEQGWAPVDVVEYARRTLGDREVALVTDAIALEATTYAPSTIDGRWAEQLETVGASTPWWPPSSAPMPQWTARYLADRLTLWLTAASVVAMLQWLAPLGRTLPLPGSPTARAATRRGNVDEKVLARVRALLAKAESTDFPEEAEALSAKAQKLMTKFSLDHILVEQVADDDDTVGERRIWIDKPYVNAMAMLVSVTASANRCKSVLSSNVGFISIVGDYSNLRLVEVLATSLLVQGNRAMLAHGTQRSAWGQSRTRSYRQSFLVSYANRIAERLDEGASAAQADVHDDRLLPALARHDARVASKYAELFPEVKPISISTSNSEGWRDGRLAADMAKLDVHRKLSN